MKYQILFPGKSKKNIRINLPSAGLAQRVVKVNGPDSRISHSTCQIYVRVDNAGLCNRKFKLNECCMERI